ncbi:hypothetical protein [Microbulbifer epialgicus]|uniref:Uncharacterized protein n=1 Tax=Microbulbifer epialgicus TaxID=393907 RepID=A0ABV4NXJ0_9GAMM
MLNKPAKLAAVRYKSLSFLDRIWIRSRLNGDCKLVLDNALRDLKKSGIKSLKYSEVTNLIADESISEVNDIGCQQDRVLPKYVSLVETGGKQKIFLKGNVTPYVSDLISTRSVEYMTGEF